MEGIVSYGVYIPKARIRIEEIWEMWFSEWVPASVKGVLGVEERPVNRWDGISLHSYGYKFVIED